MNIGFLLILVLLFAVMWLLVIRPQKRRQLEQRRMLDSLAPGAEILTAGGLYGRVRAVSDDEVRLEIAPGVEVRVAKRAVAAVMPQDDEPEEADEEEEAVGEAEDAVAQGSSRADERG
ncbi:MAG: preprotein translocase subunit YajC [Thermoleophilia bacterium]